MDEKAGEVRGDQMVKELARRARGCSHPLGSPGGTMGLRFITILSGSLVGPRLWWEAGTLLRVRQGIWVRVVAAVRGSSLQPGARVPLAESPWANLVHRDPLTAGGGAGPGIYLHCVH